MQSNDTRGDASRRAFPSTVTEAPSTSSLAAFDQPPRASQAAELSLSSLGTVAPAVTTEVPSFELKSAASMPAKAEVSPSDFDNVECSTSASSVITFGKARSSEEGTQPSSRSNAAAAQQKVKLNSRAEQSAALTDNQFSTASSEAQAFDISSQRRILKARRTKK